MPNYKVTAPTTGLTVGQVITEDDLNKNHPGLGGAQRLIGLKSLEETTDAPTPNPNDVSTPEAAEAREEQATGNQNTKTAGQPARGGPDDTTTHARRSR